MQWRSRVSQQSGATLADASRPDDALRNKVLRAERHEKGWRGSGQTGALETAADVKQAGKGVVLAKCRTLYVICLGGDQSQSHGSGQIKGLLCLMGCGDGATAHSFGNVVGRRGVTV